MLTLDHVGTPPTVVNTCPSLPAASLLTAIAALLLMSASVIVPSAIFALVTASLAIVGFGYVPVKSPPAAPVGGKLDGAPVIFDHDTSLTFASVTAPSASLAVVTEPSASVVTNVTFPVPSNDTAGAVTSPESEKLRAVCNAVAVAAFPVMLPLIALLNVHVPVTVSFCVKFP
ncbi:hypothetical protein HRbin20_00148 [bacterium HR20]|nr:hypothetical protein HRbin20_00148 [bacterium HR20]